MSYTPNTPGPGTSPAATRGPIETNFTVLNTFLGQDHVAPDEASNQCLHKKVTLVDVAAPGAQTGNQSVLYTKNVTGPQLFLRNSAGEKQITSAQVDRPTWPFWAFGRVTLTGSGGTVDLLSGSFQVTSVVREPSVGDIQGWKVTMSTAAPNPNYVVLCAAQATSPLSSAEGYGLIYKIDSTTQFTLSYRGSNGLNRPIRLSGFSFSVLVN